MAPPSPQKSLRLLLGVLTCVALALGSACARGTPREAEPVPPAPAGRSGPPAADQLKRAVARTLDEGSARVLARVRSSSDAVIVVEGVTSLVGPEAWATATVEGAPGWGSSEVRVTAAGTWLRPPGSTEWIAVDPAQAGASPAGSWANLLDELAVATDVTGGGPRLTAVVDGTPVTVVLDHRGRVAGVHRQHEGMELSFELSDFGVRVEVEPP